jgi:hypothetical protein
LKSRLYWMGRRFVGPGTAARRHALPVRAVARLARVRPRVTDDLERWSAEHGLETHVLSPAFTRVRELPIPIETTPHPNYERRRIRQVQQRVLVCLEDAKIWGANGLVVLPDGSFAAEAIYGRDHLEADRAYSTPLPRSVVHKAGEYFSLLGKFSNTGNYYHWIHDGLLRLHGVVPYLPNDVRILVPPTMHEFQRATLRLLDVRDDQLVTFSGDAVWECERLWFASLPPSGAEIPAAVEWLRESFLDACDAGHAEAWRRLYLSRSAARYGRVANESELRGLLARHHFDVVRPETMSVVEQVRLFAEAATIVSPTSSGQANVLFASRRASNLEMLEPEWATEKAYVLWTLAETLGQRFFYVLGDSVPNDANQRRPDLRVSPSLLDRALDRLVDADA